MHKRSGVTTTENTGAEPEVIAVDVRGAMAMTSLGRSTILGLADAGELPRIRFGRRVVYDVADVRRVMAERRAAEAGIHRLSPG